MRIGRGVLAGSLAGAVLVGGLLLSGAAAGPRSPDALTPTERNALRIVSVRAVGAEGGGLVVTVTFAGNIEKAIGRGNLKNALVAMILRPKDPQLATADLATEGAGRLGVTSKKTRSTAVGILRNAKTLTFFVSGPGSSNVGSVVVKAFASAPGRKPARTTSGTRVSPEQWEQIEKAIADQEERTGVLDALASGRPGEDCIVLLQMYNNVLKHLARARLRADDLKQLGKQIDAAIAQAEKKVGLKVAFAAAAAHTIGASIGIGLTVLWGQTPVHQAQTWKDLLRNLKLDRRLADALAEKNQQLINSLLELKGRLEGLHKARCNDTGTTTPPPTFKVGLKTSYMHPGGSTSTFCVLVTTTPPRPGASAKVHVSGPGVVGPADQTKTLDAAGRAVANVTINDYGEYTATADVTAGTETVSGTDSKEVKPEQATCPPP